MKSSIILDELAEIRTQCSIVGMACAQMMKTKLLTVKKDKSYDNIRMLDSALTNLNEHIVKLESMFKDLK